MDSITQLLDLEDSDIIVSETRIQGRIKTLTLETPPAAHYCPQCSFRMHSRGIKKRSISHPILQDGYELRLILKQRRWRCTNPDCGYETNEHFRFVNKQRRSTNAIDMLRSRRSDVTEPYFVSIPLQERTAVRYLLSDMYNPYLSYVDKYFPNAVPVVDSFHVIQWVVRSIDTFIRSLIRTYRQRDREREEKKSAELGRPLSLPLSDELYLLQKYRWLILASQDNITYRKDLRMDPHFRRLMNTYDYEDALFRVSPRLRTLRDLKELYIRFNARNAGNPMQADIEIEDLIDRYYHCGASIFVDFAGLLSKYHDPIINSFVMVEKNGAGKIYDSRLSNGPIESLNRKVKDLKRLGRGFRSFEHFRNRFLYATRNAPVLNAVQDNHTVLYLMDDDQED